MKDKIRTALSDSLGEETAKEIVKAVDAANYFRKKHNIPELKIDAEKAQKA